MTDEPTPAEKFEALLIDPVAYGRDARLRARAVAEREVKRRLLAKQQKPRREIERKPGL